jgi:hypothetical protein
MSMVSASGIRARFMPKPTLRANNTPMRGTFFIIDELNKFLLK